jgi:hypothetical protein
MFSMAELAQLTATDIDRLSANINHPDPTTRQDAQLKVGFYAIRANVNENEVLRGFDMLWNLFLEGGHYSTVAAQVLYQQGTQTAVIGNMFSHYFQLTREKPRTRVDILARTSAIVGFCYYCGIGTNVNMSSANYYFEQSKMPMPQINFLLESIMRYSPSASSTSSSNTAPLETLGQSANIQGVLNNRLAAWKIFKNHYETQEAALRRTIEQLGAENKVLRNENVALQFELELSRESQRWVGVLEQMVDLEKARRDQEKLARTAAVAGNRGANTNARTSVAFLYDKSRQSGDDLAILAHSAAATQGGASLSASSQEQRFIVPKSVHDNSQPIAASEEGSRLEKRQKT